MPAKRPTPEAFHPPVGVSDEVYSGNRKWAILALAALMVLAAGIGVILRP